jgi:hypothetical protein
MRWLYYISYAAPANTNITQPREQSALALLEFALEPATAVNELDEYLGKGREAVADPIKYWQARLPSPLAQMALDFLSVPGKHAAHIYLS